MAKNKPIKVSIIGDDSGFKKTLGSIDGGISRLTKGLGGIAVAMGGVFAVSSLAEAIGGLHSLGSELELLDTKINTVFADNANDVRVWADGLNESLGLSETQVAALAASTADLLKPMGFTADQAASMSMEMTELSGALSMWSGGQYDAAGVSEIMTKAMLGETDGLKALGISISAAENEQRALEIAKKDGRKEINAMDKALATQALILEKSTDAQDAYAESQGGLVGKSNQLKATWADLKEQMARGLIPIFNRIATFAVDKLAPAVGSLATKAGELWDEWGPTVMALKDELIVTLKDLAEKWFPKVMDVIDTVKGVFASGGDSTTEFGSRVTAVKEAIAAAMAAIQATVTRVLTIVRWIWDRAGTAVLDNLRGAIEHIIAAFDGLMEFVTGSFELVTAVMTGDWNAAWEAIKRMTSGAVDFIVNAVGAAWDLVGAAFALQKTALGGAMKKAWEGVVLAVSNGIRAVLVWLNGFAARTQAALGSLIGALVGKGADLIAGLLTGIVNKWNDIRDWFAGLPRRTRNAISGALNILRSTGRSIMQGLWNGLKSKWEDIKRWFTTITDMIPDWKGPAEKDRVLLKPAGELVMQGFGDGLAKGFSGVKEDLRGMTADVALTGAAGAASVSGGSVGGITVNVESNANPHQIARDVAWAMRTQ